MFSKSCKKITTYSVLPVVPIPLTTELGTSSQLAKRKTLMVKTQKVPPCHPNIVSLKIFWDIFPPKS
jgi:hypothetical protein